MPVKVPRVHIFIPGSTSRSRFEPEYVMPILQREHHGRLPDPAVGISIQPFPSDCQGDHYRWKTVESVEAERAGLLHVFGETFNACYPTERDFAAAFRRAIDAAAVLEDAEAPVAASNTAPIPEEILALKVKGLSELHMAQMTKRGLDEVGAIAKADQTTLALIVGNASLAKRLIAAAQATLKVPMPAPITAPDDAPPGAE